MTFDIISPKTLQKDKKYMDMPLQMTSAKKPCLIIKDNNNNSNGKTVVKKRVTINLE